MTEDEPLTRAESAVLFVARCFVALACLVAVCLVAVCMAAGLVYALLT